jgi:hypothetical protein
MLRESSEKNPKKKRLHHRQSRKSGYTDRGQVAESSQFDLTVSSLFRSLAYRRSTVISWMHRPTLDSKFVRLTLPLHIPLSRIRIAYFWLHSKKGSLEILHLQGVAAMRGSEKKQNKVMERALEQESDSDKDLKPVTNHRYYNSCTLIWHIERNTAVQFRITRTDAGIAHRNYSHTVDS